MIMRGSGSGLGSGPGSDAEPMDERLRHLITAEVIRGILDATQVIFGTFKERIIKIMEERLRSFGAELLQARLVPELPRSGSSWHVERLSSSGSGIPSLANVRWQTWRMLSTRVLATMLPRWGSHLVC